MTNEDAMPSIENPDIALLLLALIFAPLTLVMIIGMFKHYHLWIHLYRGDKHHHEDKDDHG